MDADLPTRLGALNRLPAVPAPDTGGRVTGWTRPVGGWLVRALATDGASAYRRAFYVLAAVLIVFSALVMLGNPCIQVIYGHDAVGFLASGWRVRNGVLPHADYHSALGALNPWICAAGLWVLGPTASVLPFCNALVAAAAGLLAWTVAARRLPAVLAAAFAATQFVVALTPHLLRENWYAATYDGYYNRQSYALIDTLLLLLFLPRRLDPDERARRRDDYLAGAFLGGLFFVKISYFAVGVGLCGLAFVLVRQSWRSLPWGWTLGFGVVFVLGLPLIRFDLAAMFGDLRWAAVVRAAGDQDARFTVAVYLARLSEAWIEVGLLTVLQIFLCVPRWLRSSSGAGTPMTAPGWVEFAGIVGASALLCATNSPGGDHSETPLLTSWVFVLLGCHVGGLSVAAPVGRLRAVFLRRNLTPACCLAGLLWVYTFGNGFACLCWSACPVRTPSQKNLLSHAPVIEADSLANLRIPGEGGDSSHGVYADKVNDGLRLLRTLSSPHRVETLDFVNPFPFALQWPIARGGVWCWDIGFSFSPALYPPAAEAFGEIDVLMVPKHPNKQVTFDAMRKIYGPYLQEHYELASESDQWYLLLRR